MEKLQAGKVLGKDSEIWRGTATFPELELELELEWEWEWARAAHCSATGKLLGVFLRILRRAKHTDCSKLSDPEAARV